jgi:hypothetical protein
MADDSGLGMPLNEAIETQRAIRRLKPDPVDDGLIPNGRSGVLSPIPWTMD